MDSPFDTYLKTEDQPYYLPIISSVPELMRFLSM